ncbi:MAG: hypothetical protein ABIH76_02415 [Candidatus Bathyarchaeota archaeon]
MKKLFASFLILTLVSSVFLVGSAQEDPSSEIEIEETLEVQEQEYSKARNSTELRQKIQERSQEMEQEILTVRDEAQNFYRNQSRVQLAAHSLLAAEDLLEGIGSDVSQIATQLNNSVQVTIRAEERIHARNQFMKFLIGGDEVAADEILQETIQNQLRIQQIQQLLEDGQCDEDVKIMLQQQIQDMQQEQIRLQQLAQEEKNNKGLFGWLWK